MGPILGTFPALYRRRIKENVASRYGHLFETTISHVLSRNLFEPYKRTDNSKETPPRKYISSISDNGKNNITHIHILKGVDILLSKIQN